MGLRREEVSLLVDPKPYRALVGSLMYLTITRPDIAFSIGYVSKFMQSPRKPHLKAAKKILKYINSTSDMSLFFKRKNDLVLIEYTDTDFGSDMDNQRSTSGYIFLCGGTVISQFLCQLRRQNIKATSLTAQECVWLQRLAEDLHRSISKTTTIFGDDQSAIKLTNNSVFHVRSKHIEVEHHFIPEKVLDGTLYTSEV
ncbi:secreted RxLR effector protein 161-like [Solanum lycopersicum]|uniref:secreted RxLR effector protein 161-like n=1 Tax=Solanum lycopersicum TaxID=4081 RepID=UPI003749AB91